MTREISIVFKPTKTPIIKYRNNRTKTVAVHDKCQRCGLTVGSPACILIHIKKLQRHEDRYNTNIEYCFYAKAH